MQESNFAQASAEFMDFVRKSVRSKRAPNFREAVRRSITLLPTRTLKSTADARASFAEFCENMRRNGFPVYFPRLSKRALRDRIKFYSRIAKGA